VAVLRWSLVRVFFRACFAFVDAGRQHRKMSAGSCTLISCHVVHPNRTRNSLTSVVVLCQKDFGGAVYQRISLLLLRYMSDSFVSDRHFFFLRAVVIWYCDGHCSGYSNKPRIMSCPSVHLSVCFVQAVNLMTKTVEIPKLM